MRLLHLLPLALLPTVSAQGAVHVVDEGGAGAFTDLQSAIDAAADGDVVLVEAGAYGPFTIAGKGVSVIADTDGQVFVHGPWTVSGVPAGSLAVLRGLRTGIPDGHGVTVSGCDGAVRIEECVAVGQDAPDDFEAEVTFHGASVEGSASVLFARSTLTGGQGGNLGFFGTPTSGGSGLLARESAVVVTDCTLRGGHGASAPHDEWYPAGHGGNGVWAFGSRVWMSGCTAYGGGGGDGDEDFDPLFGTLTCGDGGDGGSGLRVESFWLGSGPLPTEATVRDLTAFPGSGGGATCGAPGADGAPITVDQPGLHAILELPGAARGAWASSPVRGGQNARLYAEGAPGDLAVAAIGQPASFLALPGQALPIAIAPPGPVLVLGPIPSGGLLMHTVPVPPLAAGFGGLTLSLQGAAIPSGGPGFEIAPFGTITLLEPAF